MANRAHTAIVVTTICLGDSQRRIHWLRSRKKVGVEGSGERCEVRGVKWRTRSNTGIVERDRRHWRWIRIVLLVAFCNRFQCRTRIHGRAQLLDGVIDGMRRHRIVGYTPIVV